MHITVFGSKIRLGWSVIILPVLIFLIACGASDREGKMLFDRVYSRYDSLYRTLGKAASARFVDSLTQHKDNASPDYMVAYFTCRTAQSYYDFKLDSNGIYNDSTALLIEKFGLQNRHAALYLGSLASKGDRNFSANNLMEAFEYYSRAIIFAIKIGDSCNIANLNYHLGMVSYRQKKFSEAIRYFKEATSQNRACNDNNFAFYRVVELYGNIGLAYTQIGQNDSALENYRLSLNYISSNRARLARYDVDRFSEIATGVALGNMAKVFMAAGQPDSSEVLLQKSIAINYRPDFDRKDAMYAMMQLAELYFATAKTDKAMEALSRIEARLAEFPENDIRIRWEHLMYLIAKMKALPGAFGHLEAYVSLRNKTDSANANLQKTDYGQLVQMKEAQYQITLLRKNEQLSRIYLYFSLAAIATVLIIVGLVYRNYSRSRRNVAELTKLNNQINEQKARLQDAMELLSKSNTEKDRILNIVVHDLRNPVSAVLSIIDLLGEDNLDDEQRSLLKMMRNAAAGSLTLINELLEFSDRHTAQSKNKERIDVNVLVSNAVDVLRFKAREKKQTLALQLAPEPLYCFVNAAKIGRVVSNLITNSIKFSPLNATVTVSTALSDTHLRITVSDNGIGIPADVQAHIFNPFSEARRKGTAGEVSYGVGLSICRQIVEAENGTIHFVSTEGAGSDFYVELPLNEAPSPTVPDSPVIQP